MSTHEPQHAIEQLIQRKPLVDGQNWLIETHSDEIMADTGNRAYGWKHQHQAPQASVSTWGGTVDGVRGLLACGLSPADPVIEESVRWMISQQQSDGSFAATWGITWSCVEATAWTLIVLREFDSVRKNVVDHQVIARAVAFLEGCIKIRGGLGTSNHEKDALRVYPSAITLWAVHGLSRREGEIADYLKSAVCGEGGWSTHSPVDRSGARVIPAMTAIVLYVLLATEHITTGDPLCITARDALLQQKNQHGTWNTYTEEWFSAYQKSGELPNACGLFTPAWAVLALLKAEVDVLNPAIVQATAWLILHQESRTHTPLEKGGAWLFDRADTSVKTWCTSNALICLNEVRQHLLAPRLIHRSQQPTYRALMYTQREAFFRAYLTHNTINSFLLVLLFLVILRDPLLTVCNGIILYLLGQQDNIASNLISNGIWVLLVLVGGKIVRTTAKALAERRKSAEQHAFLAPVNE